MSATRNAVLAAGLWVGLVWPAAQQLGGADVTQQQYGHPAAAVDAAQYAADVAVDGRSR